MRRFVILFATWWGTGYSPIASGTVGTLAAIPLYLLLVRLPILYYLLSLIPLTLFSCWIAGKAETIFNEKDSGKIVIDEVVGYLITMIGASPTWSSVILGFFMFRFFDIVKVPPANIIDRRMKNGWGVVLDDVVAGLYACLLLHILLRFI
ncbi:MAG TPA: phosphatidylglycerophosphatase A [Geobacteraceae bacterium]|nr:phosphatidylglycerophosphatase A [Geobacteraceae bacterium]